jgi:hypothetical protein
MVSHCKTDFPHREKVRACTKKWPPLPYWHRDNSEAADKLVRGIQPGRDSARGFLQPSAQINIIRSWEPMLAASSRSSTARGFIWVYVANP